MAELRHPTIGKVGSGAQVPNRSGSAAGAYVSSPAGDILSGAAEAAEKQQGRAEEEEHADITSSHSRNDLQSLVELGMVEDSITIGAKTFRMHTLDDDTQENLLKRASEAGGADGFLMLRRMVAAMAIETVNGKPVENFAEGCESDDPADRKIFVVSKLQNVVVNRLYEFYEQLVGRSNENINPEQVKN